MRKTFLLAAAALPLAACTTSPYGYGADPVGSIIGSIGTLGSGYGQSPYGYGYGSGYGYGGNFSQAAAQACASVASRYGGAVQVTSVRQADRNDRLRVRGYVQRGYGADDWGCTFRSDGRITDFDI